MQPFEIFRAGRHHSMDGREIAFSEADLAGSVAAYDVALHEAPLVVGHPKTNAPAYGWVKGLSIKGDRVVAIPGQVDPAFAEMVETGRFKKRSASFYPPDDPVNPKPGAWYLKHVGFLGAQPPAVKGLKEVAFAEDDGSVEFADWNALTVARLLGQLRDFLIGQFGQDKADSVLPAFDIDSLKFDAAQPEDADPGTDPNQATPIPAYSEPSHRETEMNKDETAKAALDAREAALKAQEAAFAERSKAARHADIAAFADAIVAAGKIPAGIKAGLVAFMEAIPAEGGDATIEFAEAGGTTAKADASAWFRDFLAKLPKLVPTGEVAGNTGDIAFAESGKAPLDPSSIYRKHNAAFTGGSRKGGARNRQGDQS